MQATMVNNYKFFISRDTLAYGQISGQFDVAISSKNANAICFLLA